MPRLSRQFLACWAGGLLVKLSYSDFPYTLTVSGGTTKQAIGAIGGICLLSFLMLGCAGGNLSTREKGAGVGAAVGHPGAGAAIGGALGLGTGVLVGDQLQGQENRQADQQWQIDANQAEIQRQRRDMETLRRQGEY